MAPTTRNIGRFREKFRESFDFPQGGTFAAGTLVVAANAAAADGDTVTINDGFRIVVYEYDKSSNGVVAGRITIPVGTTAGSNGTALAGLIAANQPAITVTDDLAGNLTLTHKWPGAGANATITKSGALITTATGMTGGQNPSGNTLVTSTVKLHSVKNRTIRIDRVILSVPAGLAQDASNYCDFRLIQGASTIIAHWSTQTTTGQGSIVASTPVDMVLSATDANRYVADTVNLSLLLNLTGTPIVPPGRIVVEGYEL